MPRVDPEKAVAPATAFSLCVLQYLENGGNRVETARFYEFQNSDRILEYSLSERTSRLFGNTWK